MYSNTTNKVAPMKRTNKAKHNRTANQYDDAYYGRKANGTNNATTKTKGE